MKKTTLLILLLGVVSLTACSGGPAADPTPVVVTPPVAVAHRGPLFIQIDPDITGSYPPSLMSSFIKQMAGWIEKLPAVNSESVNRLRVLHQSRALSPQQFPDLLYHSRSAELASSPPQTPIPQCPNNPYSCTRTQGTATTANSEATQTYQQQLKVVHGDLATVQQATDQDAQKMLALHPGVDNIATSILGVLNLASQRFRGQTGEKWLILATDLGNNEEIDAIPPDLSGVHVLVMDLYCIDAVECQSTKDTWSSILKNASAASITYLDPEASQTFSSPWS